jgi:hypothetical protein
MNATPGSISTGTAIAFMATAHGAISPFSATTGITVLYTATRVMATGDGMTGDGMRGKLPGVLDTAANAGKTMTITVVSTVVIIITREEEKEIFTVRAAKKAGEKEVAAEAMTATGNMQNEATIHHISMKHVIPQPGPRDFFYVDTGNIL